MSTYLHSPCRRRARTTSRLALWVSLGFGLVVGGCSGSQQRDLTAEERTTIENELRARLERDQYYRAFDYSTASDSARREMMREAMSVDSANLVYIRQLVDSIGWPDSGRFGAEAARAAFLLVQHADRDPEFQARMLPELTAAVNRGEASARDLAYLVDRVRVKQGRPQVYGTQYDIMRDSAGNVSRGADGKLQYRIPVVVDPNRLDERRAAVGLQPWADYEQEMAKMQDRAPVPRPLADTLETGQGRR